MHLNAPMIVLSHPTQMVERFNCDNNKALPPYHLPRKRLRPEGWYRQQQFLVQLNRRLRDKKERRERAWTAKDLRERNLVQAQKRQVNKRKRRKVRKRVKRS